MEHKTNIQLIRDSLRDLIRVYEPPPSKAVSFVTWFIKKYRIDRGFESELLKYAKEEIAKLDDSQSE